MTLIMSVMTCACLTCAIRSHLEIAEPTEQSTPLNWKSWQFHTSLRIVCGIQNSLPVNIQLRRPAHMQKESYIM